MAAPLGALRLRRKQKANLRVLRPEDDDDFAASVERDLAQLPVKEPDRKS
jgi:hypothetical protein